MSTTDYIALANFRMCDIGRKKPLRVSVHSQTHKWMAPRETATQILLLQYSEVCGRDQRLGSAIFHGQLL